MAELLYRLGRFASRRAWTVIFAWVAVLAAAAIAFLLGRGPLAAGFDIPGTETAAVTRTLDEKIPGRSGGSATIVFRTTDASPMTERQRAAVSEIAERARTLPYVSGVVDPFATEATRRGQAEQMAAGRAQLTQAQAQIPPGAQFDAQRQRLAAEQARLDLASQLLAVSQGIRLVAEDGGTALVALSFTETRLTLPDSAKAAAREHFLGNPIEGLAVDVSLEIASGVPSIVTAAEIAGVVIAGLVLLVMLGTLVAAGLPILTALVGLAIGMLATLALSSVVQVASVTPVLGVMLGLAVGIDYALFVVNRHRRQLAGGMEISESIGLANGTAGNAVVFAGSTVLVALLALNVTGIPFLGLMGTVGAVCVAVAVLISVSLTPALLGLAGQAVISARLRRQVARGSSSPAPAAMPTWRAVAGVLGGAAALLAIAVPALSMRLGLPDGSAEAQDSTQYRAYQVIAQKFGEGVNGPLLVTAALPQAQQEPEALQAQVRLAQWLAQQEDVVAVAPVATSADQTFFAFQVVPAHGPTSVSTESLVRHLRASSPLPDGTTLGVAGQATGNIDISDKLRDALPLYLAVVIGLSTLIMVVVFRSLVVPLAATAGFVLSLFATYGALIAIYQWGWLNVIFGVHDPGPLLNFLPIVLVGILFGLAMDYQLFLASGMREAYVHGTPAREAVVNGLRAGRAVVTAAGIIMIAVFGGFIFSDTTVVRPLGFGLAFGVLADAFVVRMLVVPGLLHLFGDAAWWLPRWADRLLPHVDIEGAALEKRHHQPAQP